MRAVGIVAEYNPFHRGHAHHIAATRALLEEDAAVVAVMSGNWVQRGECAVTDKWTRTGTALVEGVDLVLELPTMWAVSSAERFARGAVELLHASGVVDVLSFGSECGDVSKLQELAACLDSAVYRSSLRRFLDEGMPFAVCRQKVTQRLLGDELAGLLSLPNNNLGVEYLRALNALKSGIHPVSVPRLGAAHDGEISDGFASAALLRAWLRAGKEEKAAPYLSVPWKGEPASMDRCELALLAKFRTMDAADWAALPDSAPAEGLPDRLLRAGRAARSLAEFYPLAKSKRYTHARLRRLALWAFLGYPETGMPEHPPYLRVLGMNQTGRKLLREMKEKAALPILTKPAHVRALGEDAQRLFALESQATDLYALCLEHPWPCGREYTTGPVIIV